MNFCLSIGDRTGFLKIQLGVGHELIVRGRTGVSRDSQGQDMSFKRHSGAGQEFKETFKGRPGVSRDSQGQDRSFKRQSGAGQEFLKTVRGKTGVSEDSQGQDRSF